MIGGVDHFGDLRHRLENRALNPFLQGRCAHRAPLAATTHRDERLLSLDPDEFGIATVGGQRGVDALGLVGANLVGGVADKFELPKVTQRVGAIGVADHETALAGNRRQVERGAAHRVDTVRRNDDRQAVVGVHKIIVGGLGHRLEREVVGVVGTVGTGDLDSQAQKLSVVLVGPDVEHRRTSGIGDDHDLLGGVGGGGVGHGDQANAASALRIPATNQDPATSGGPALGGSRRQPTPSISSSSAERSSQASSAAARASSCAASSVPTRAIAS